MDLEMVLNELSMQTPAADIPTARQWMSELIGTLRQATVSGVKRVVRTSDEINTFELAPGYPVARWRNDPEVNREERSYFRTLIAKFPLWTDDVAIKYKDEFYLSEVKYQGEEAKGLGFALIIDALAVSLKSEPRWDCSCLELEVKRLDENGELIDEQVKIIHASRISHVQQHADWIKNRIRTAVCDGVELWTRKDKLFPNLEFCKKTNKQIQSLKSSNPMLRHVVNRLLELDDYCKSWKDGYFNPNNLHNATPESESRLDRFEEELTFECSDGEERIFSWHVRMTPGAWRLHFSTELGPGKIVIGYIGLKIQ